MIHNMRWTIIVSGLSVAVLGLALAGCGGQNNAAENTTGTTTTTTTAPDATTSTTTAPDTSTGTGTATGGTADAAAFKDAAATWKQVMAAKAGLDNVIKAKKLKVVHEAAFKLRDIVKTLPAKSSALSPDKQKALASQIKNIEGLAKLLDEAGDSNNLKATQDNQSGVNDALDIIKGLYPAGALGAA